MLSKIHDTPPLISIFNYTTNKGVMSNYSCAFQGIAKKQVYFCLVHLLFATLFVNRQVNDNFYFLITIKSGFWSFFFAKDG